MIGGIHLFRSGYRQVPSSYALLLNRPALALSVRFPITSLVAVRPPRLARYPRLRCGSLYLALAALWALHLLTDLSATTPAYGK